MRHGLKTPLILAVLLVVLGLTGIGCGWWSFSGELEETSDGAELANTTSDPSQAPDILIGDQTQSKQTMVMVDLYFVDQESGKLMSESRSIPKVTGIARAAVEELVHGPAAGSELISIIPQDTLLLDINVRPDGRCIVDLSRDFQSNLAKDSQSEVLAVYSLVNTLTQFSTVKDVQVLLEGQMIETLKGEVNLNEPLMRNETLIKH